MHRDVAGSAHSLSLGGHTAELIEVDVVAGGSGRSRRSLGVSKMRTIKKWITFQGICILIDAFSRNFKCRSISRDLNSQVVEKAVWIKIFKIFSADTSRGLSCTCIHFSILVLVDGSVLQHLLGRPCGGCPPPTPRGRRCGQGRCEMV